jgi:pimeloyl-ACP methyl ester carboxylesterase
MTDSNPSHLLHIPADSTILEGNLDVPLGARSLVIFAHGSGSSRHSGRNKYVAKVLSEAGIGTLLFDLLTREEDSAYENRFDIALLTDRLITVTRWIQGQKQNRRLSIGYFGASTGAAAALMAAARLGREIGAVVSRGGRPDLAVGEIENVKSPTLFIVGGNDFAVIQLNQQAYNLLKCEKDMIIIPGATHLFEEPGTLEEVARLASGWFGKYLLSET